ncbi:serine hydrolase [Tenericutes bacterium MZ-XQ]|nr:serine hydrolase [Tenericutes bacterium MZ-XQ]
MQEFFKSGFTKITDGMINHKAVYGAIFNVESEENHLSMLGSSGNLNKDDYYYIASVTKLYVTAMIIILRNLNKLSLDDSITSFFRKDELKRLHVLRDVDYTEFITIRHLLCNQSGLKDYYYYDVSGSKAVDELEQKDTAWTFIKAMDRVKTLKPLFKPGQAKKVNYSDTNFKILGQIIEHVTDMSIDQVFEQYLFKPLDLKHTFVFKEDSKKDIAPIYFKTRKINIPKYMASVPAEGGIVAKASDVMVFIKAFFNGFYFPKEQVQELKQNYRMIFFPGQFYFGTGMEKLWVPRFMSLKFPIKNVLGFWGQTGAFAFYDEDTKLYFTGTINQTSGFGHGQAFKAIIKMIKMYRKEFKAANSFNKEN